MRPRKRLLVYRCRQDEDFWVHLKARGFELSFVDSDKILREATRKRKWGAVVTTSSEAWTEAAQAVRQGLGVGEEFPVLLLPLSSRRVSIFRSEGEKMPPPRTYAQLAQTVEEAVSGKWIEDADQCLHSLGDELESARRRSGTALKGSGQISQEATRKSARAAVDRALQSLAELVSRYTAVSSKK